MDAQAIKADNNPPEQEVTESPNQLDLSSKTSSMPTKLTLETFPLEIKHEIFSHLLKGRKVKETLKIGNRPAIRFAWDKALLRVNKRLGEEAKHYLYSANVFVSLETQWPPSFAHLASWNGAAIVAEQTHDRFPHYSLRVAFKALPDEGVTFEQTFRSHHCIVLHDDFEKLSRSIQLNFNLNCGHSITITSSPDVVPTKFRFSLQPKLWNVEISLNNHHYMPVYTKLQDAIRQQELLSPLSKLSSGEQTISFLGGVNDQIAATLRSDMTPVIAWFDATGWELHDRMRESKTYLDSLLLADNSWDPEYFFDLYSQLAWKTQAPMFHFHQTATDGPEMGTVAATFAIKFLPSGHDAIAKSWQLGVIVMSLECYMTCAFLSIKMASTGSKGDILEDPMGWLRVTTDLIEAHEGILKAIPPPLTALINHLTVVIVFTTTQGLLSNQVAHLTQLLSEGPTEWLKADIELCRQYISSGGPALDINTTSLQNRSPCYSFPLDIERPQQFKGHRNLNHKLDRDTEEQLIALAIKREKMEKSRKTMWTEHYYLLQAYGFVPP